MHAPQISLPSITGVDVQLRIAGAGNRSYAFVIDWHIRFILALAWFFGAAFLYTGTLGFLASGNSGAGGSFLLVVTVPALAIYFLYHPVLEIAMHGRTPGKRIAGVRLITRTGDIPGPGALLLRNVFRLIDSLPFMYMVGLGSVIFTAQHVRIGDLAAGTLLIVDSPEAESSFASFRADDPNGLSPQAADLVQELLDRWTALDEMTRAGIARSLIARIDPAASADELAAQNARDLHERLKALLAPGHSA